MEAYQKVCSEVVLAFGGHVAKYLGDGIVVFFGYPLAHEDDAQRAVRAAVRIANQAPQIEPALQDKHNIRMAVRVGVHTGLVVAGELGVGNRRSLDIVGETPALAARLQEMAQPNSVVISASTLRLISREFEVRSIGERVLRGLSRPTEIFQVLAERDPQTMKTLESESQRLVGREHELRLLLDRWEKADTGAGQVVLLSADPGIGKTRLSLELQWNISNRSAAHIVEVRCSAYYQSSPFYPVIEVLQRQILGFLVDDSAENKLHRVEAYCEALELPLPVTIPILVGLLSLSLQDRYVPLRLSPEAIRQRTIELVVEIVMRRASQQPLLLLIENVHWADPSTLEVLQLITEQSATARMLLLMTFRPTFTWPGDPAENVLQLTLERLEDRDMSSMIAQLAGGARLPDEVIQQIITKTDGVPLFVEELTKMVLESGILVRNNGNYTLTAALSDLSIPTTLQDSLMARLDRLNTVKEIAQVAAVIGREFSSGLLMAITKLEEPPLRRELGRLVDAELLNEVKDTGGGISYRFKHALIQDAAYNSLLISRRQQYHRDIAVVIETSYPETADGQPGLLANHYAAASMAMTAIGYWIRAGQQALARSANFEAIADFNRVLELLKGLPETAETLQMELVAQAGLGIALSATHGFSTPEVGAAFSRAAALCEVFGETPELFPVLWGLRAFYVVRGELQTSLTIVDRLLRMAETTGDSDLQLEGHFIQGSTFYWTGQLEEARCYLEHAVEIYDPEQHRSHALIYGQDPGVVSLCFLGYALWHLGYVEQSGETIRQALALAQKISDPVSISWE
ncbi:MAG: AAA family ATPase, partial [Armatimonadota bacterium]|nr:AAA family ATPase [Armatimonadota bacterium]